MALVAVEVAKNATVKALRHWWVPGQTIYLDAAYVPAALAAGIVVPVGTYVPPVWGG
jgi:hypothetical protein